MYSPEIVAQTLLWFGASNIPMSSSRQFYSMTLDAPNQNNVRRSEFRVLVIYSLFLLTQYIQTSRIQIFDISMTLLDITLDLSVWIGRLTINMNFYRWLLNQENMRTANIMMRSELSWGGVGGLRPSISMLHQVPDCWVSDKPDQPRCLV